MKTSRTRQDRKASRARQWATRSFPCVSDRDPALSQEVRERVTPWLVESGSIGCHDFPVTLEGFVTMAIIPQLATRHEDTIAVPGFDEHGRSGHLVLQPGCRPYHSRESNPGLAVQQARAAIDKSRRLVQAFGDREAMERACRSAGWFKRVTIADANAAGLCDWGIECFLRSLGLWFVARHFGLPKGAIWMGGRYPRRAIAAALLRSADHRPAEQIFSELA